MALQPQAAQVAPKLPFRRVRPSFPGAADVWMTDRETLHAQLLDACNETRETAFIRVLPFSMAWALRAEDRQLALGLSVAWRFLQSQKAGVELRNTYYAQGRACPTDDSAPQHRRVRCERHHPSQAHTHARLHRTPPHHAQTRTRETATTPCALRFPRHSPHSPRLVSDGHGRPSAPSPRPAPEAASSRTHVHVCPDALRPRVVLSQPPTTSRWA